MTEFEMLEKLLQKTGRIYDQYNTEDKIIVQIHVADIRHEFDFNKNGELTDEWENHSPTTWISNGAYIYE